MPYTHSKAASHTTYQSQSQCGLNTKFYDSVSTSTMNAAEALVNMRYTKAKRNTNVSGIFANYTNWYDAFVSEVRGEGYSPAEICSEADKRWVTFCAKSLRCDESVVINWLNTK